MGAGVDGLPKTEWGTVVVLAVATLTAASEISLSSFTLPLIGQEFGAGRAGSGGVGGGLGVGGFLGAVGLLAGVAGAGFGVAVGAAVTGRRARSSD
ncbi:hypothetical protein [Actinocorallia sp. API 0066]|uniref:hypothetical protein n=1 Tax=Actinocorallia sp. API 0066 TaxID=2896846 RepID=UPI00271450B6|nr:hypothetical protein [Actinocorallia sp. API 0066]